MKKSLGYRDSRHKCTGLVLNGSVLPNMNLGNGSGWRRRLESSRAGTAAVKAGTGGAGNSSRAVAGTGLRARLGGGEYKVAFWLTPSLA